MTESDPDYYTVLHVSRDAPEQIIRASYRTLMQTLKNHPDLGGDPAAAALINEAYAVLTDRTRRQRYDADLATAKSRADTPPASRQKRLDPHRECVFCALEHPYGRAIERDARCKRCQSPLSPVAGRRLEERDARAVTRVQKRQAVELITRWPPSETISGRTEDVSLSGMRLVTRQPFAIGQLVRLRSVELESVARVVNITAHKRGWSTDYEAGLEFVTLIFTKSRGAFVSRQA